jgi:tRNA(His) 5'-end guanylyltransferase
MPEKSHMLPIFDARVWQYPNLDLAADSFLWRETDATRNSLTMAAHSEYSHTELHKAGFARKHDLLHAAGINWNDYPAFFKRGTYVAKRKIMKKLSDKELMKIPEAFRQPDTWFERSEVFDLGLPEYTKIDNINRVFFFGEDPAGFA